MGGSESQTEAYTKLLASPLLWQSVVINISLGHGLLIVSTTVSVSATGFFGGAGSVTSGRVTRGVL